jgi:NAD(P)-dependent dehydrogenase (short-subunit alcohol dehydrogenase family)
MAERTGGEWRLEGGRLAGKVAIVTGAGQQAGEKIGNGKAAAMVFAREGASVALMDRERAAAEETCREIEASGGSASAIEGDVSVEEDCHAAVAACRERFGGLDVLHHNVGVGLGDRWVESIEMSEWERIMRVNAGGALLMAKAALPLMRAQESGVITNVSSIAAVVAGTSRTNNPTVAYKMSKAAMNALTVSMAQSYARYGVRVNAILPGLIDTPMGVDTVARALHITREQYVEIRNESVPLKGGMGSAWDIANAALFLASDEARFITGVLLAVDGGQSARTG